MTTVNYISSKPLTKISTLAIHIKNTATKLDIDKESQLKPIIE